MEALRELFVSNVRVRYVNRREFLGTSAALATTTMLPFKLGASAPPKVIKVGFAEAALMGMDKPKTAVMAYNAQIPGPTIRIPQGKRVNFLVKNGLDQPTSVHWHGIRLENRMDGVPGLTQDPIAPGEDFGYNFIAPDAGTYWYHSHVKSWEQVGRGLYGPLIVEETAPIEVDSDHLFVADDWRLDDAGQIAGNFGHMRDASHGGRLGNWLTINGATKPTFVARPGERIRLRCISVANARIMEFAFPGLIAQMVAIDGQPLSAARSLDSALTLAPAQRADLVIDVPVNGDKEYVINEVSTGEPLVAALVVVSGEPIRAHVKEPGSLILPANPLPSSIPLENALVVDLHMEGGAMGQLREATYQGQMFDLRSLVMKKGKAWTFNGEAGTTVSPLFKTPFGQTVTVNMVNDTRWPHAMHIHGHHFRVIEKNGNPVSNSPWRDTELMEPGDKTSISFIADNPGKWLFHCHMLEHHMAGMGTWFDVGLPS
jgi:FtsP/CotA-like multicopper oxidase with cupredoxin domain